MQPTRSLPESHGARRGRRRRRNQRRGSYSVALIIGMSVLLGFMALAIDMAMVRLAAVEAQGACDATSRGAVALMFDPDLLCPALKDLAVVRPDGSLDTDAIRTFAISYAGKNQIRKDDVVLQGSDIVFQQVPDPTSFNAGGSSSAPFNTIQVTCPRTAARGTPITMFFAKSLGKTEVDLTSISRASLDQRVVGFEPVLLIPDLVSPSSADQSPVPMLPILASPVAWNEQTCVTFSDSATVDCTTGIVDESTGDGIPEVTLTMSIEGTPAAMEGELRLLNWEPDTVSPGSPLDASLLAAQISGGIVISDLAALGGRLLMDVEGPDFANGRLVKDLSQPTLPGRTDSLLQSVCSSLQGIRGQLRIIPLGAETATAQRIGGMIVTPPFAAAAVVRCTFTPADVPNSVPASLTLVLQPCLLPTSTALTTVLPGLEGRNPFLGKVIVNQ